MQNVKEHIVIVRYVVFLCCFFAGYTTLCFGTTKNVHWGDDISTTCETNNDINVPSQIPVSLNGYHFVGWKTRQVIEYIEADGTQYIDTEIYANQKTSVYIVFQLTNLNKSHQVIGTSKYNIQTINTNGGADRQWGTRHGTTTAQHSNRIANSQKVILYKNKNLFYIDDVLVATLSTKKFSDSQTMYVYGYQNVLNTNSNYGSGRVFELRIYDDDILVRDYIPVLDSDGEACLWDKVQDQFYHNLGTGSFTSGQIISSIPTSENLYSPNDIIHGGCSGKAGDIYFYPIFEPNTVLLNYDNGDGTSQNDTCTYDGIITNVPTAPFKAGYTFIGWAVNND